MAKAKKKVSQFEVAVVGDLVGEMTKLIADYKAAYPEYAEYFGLLDNSVRSAIKPSVPWPASRWRIDMAGGGSATFMLEGKHQTWAYARIKAEEYMYTHGLTCSYTVREYPLETK